MPLSIRNPRTVALAREVAALKGKGITETIHEALEAQRARSRPDPAASVPLSEATRRIVDEFRADGRTGLVADKAFVDSLYEE